MPNRCKMMAAFAKRKHPSMGSLSNRFWTRLSAADYFAGCAVASHGSIQKLDKAAGHEIVLWLTL
jgi:hypothetical protein